MRIIFISTMTGWPWGGSEELWSQTAVRLAAAGHEVSALIEKRIPLGEKAAALPKQSVNLRLRDVWQGTMTKAVIQRLTGWRPKDGDQEWLLQQKPDLVVISQGSNTDGVLWLNLCRERGLPYAAIVQCNAETAWPADKNVDELAAAFQGARGVYCVSQHNLRLLEWQLGGALPNAQVVWNPNKAAALELLPWPTESGKMRMACVARLEPMAKGQDVLLQTLAQPQWRARAVELSLYGAGPYEKTLRAMAQRLALGHVNFCGHVANIADIWRENHLLVLPSRYEGLPLALIEAMSCGRPAVVTDVGGNAELCVDGETGFVASAAAVGPLDEALERAWARRGDWPALGRAARARVLQIIPSDPVAVFCGLLEKIAGSASAPQ
jgi:glycosyltransferase involved in cell wall biosynthesis